VRKFFSRWADKSTYSEFESSEIAYPQGEPAIRPVPQRLRAAIVYSDFRVSVDLQRQGLTKARYIPCCLFRLRMVYDKSEFLIVYRSSLFENKGVDRMPG
jgi:hypothetical protein